MSRRVQVRAEAKQDLRVEAAYIAGNSSAAARRFKTAVREAFERLLELPHLGSPCEFRNPEWSSLQFSVVRGFRNHLIIYRPIDAGIEIIRILHGARNWQVLFEGDERNP